MMNRFTMLVGLPGSGKSTVANELVNSVPDCKVFSSDLYRKIVCGDENDQSQNGLVFDTLYADMIKHLEDGGNAIFDATNVTRKTRRKCLERIKHIKCEKVALIVPTFIDVCIERDAQRERTVGAEVIHKFASTFEVPMTFEGFDAVSVYTQGTFKKYENMATAVACKMITFDQKNHHHLFTVGEHCNAVVEGVLELTPKIKGSSTALLIAAMWHDVGKLYTQSFDAEGEAHYYQHANYSALWLLGEKDIMNSVDSTEDFLDTAFYVGEHMHIRDIIKSEKAIKKYQKLFGETYFHNLMLLMECDNYGSKRLPRLTAKTLQNISITDIDVYEGDYAKGIYITWECPNVGFGEYKIYIKDGHLMADTECMDAPTLKLFTKALMNKLIDDIEIMG